jgi:hypothetical protein
MTNGILELVWKGWDSLKAWVTAMDYSVFDYTNDRMRGLEQEVKELKDELRRTRISTEPTGGGFEQSAPVC